ncbi:MAG: TerC family protein [Hyphomicrobium sp.]
MNVILAQAGFILDTLVTDIGLLLSPEWWRAHAIPLFHILMIDLTLAGDNAIVVGMAAAKVDPKLRPKVIFWGIFGAVILRILFSAVAQQMLQIIGLTLAGGLLLLFVCWKMYQQIVDGETPSIEDIEAGLSTETKPKNAVSFWGALWTIVLADLSMSLDNVLAVAGAAKESTLVLVIGLLIAIILMAVASSYIAKLLYRHPWIAWIGLFIIIYVALDMIYRDSHQLACATWGVGCSETIWQGIKHRLGF